MFLFETANTACLGELPQHTSLLVLCNALCWCFRDNIWFQDSNASHVFGKFSTKMVPRLQRQSRYPKVVDKNCSMYVQRRSRYRKVVDENGSTFNASSPFRRCHPFCCGNIELQKSPRRRGDNSGASTVFWGVLRLSIRTWLGAKAEGFPRLWELSNSSPEMVVPVFPARGEKEWEERLCVCGTNGRQKQRMTRATAGTTAIRAGR